MEKIGGPIKLFLFTICVFVLGAFFGFSQKPDSFFVETVSGKENTEVVSSADFEIFWTAWKTLDEKFPDAKNISEEERIYGAIEGLAYSFKDPYTEFLNKKEYKNLNDDLKGDLVGIGVEIDTKEGIPTVISPLEGSPAEKAGMLPGDMILKVDDKSTERLSLDEVVTLIRGKEGTEVKLLILSAEEKIPKEITIVRALIKVPSLKTEIKDDVFVIHFYDFYDNSVPNFTKAMQEFEESGLKKIIVDVRGNPGGYLESAIKISSWFIPEGEVVVREKFAEGKEEDEYRSIGLDKLLKNKPQVAILVDSYSASASEIFAGALREQSNAKLFGTKTYGKGSVQEVIDLPNNTALKVTVAKWLTPEGISISDTGLEPDFNIEDNQDTDKDEVLEEALKYLRK